VTQPNTLTIHLSSVIADSTIDLAAADFHPADFHSLTFIPWITAHGIHRPILEISLARTEVQVEVRAGAS
jgi:hypothetical protein